MQRLLENDVIGPHCYQVDGEDPDLCQPFATCLWELILVSNRHEPSLMELFKSLLDRTSIPFSSLELENQTSPELTNDIIMPKLTQMRRRYRLQNVISSPFLDSLRRILPTTDILDNHV